MRSTLFFIPHAIGPLPVLGLGWMLIALVVVAVVLVIYRRALGMSWQLSIGDWFSWLIGAAVIVFLLPRIETYYPLPEPDGGSYPVGLPIRGYGLMLMSGVIGAAWMTQLRSKALGLGLDQLLSLAFFTVVGGIGGARVFFVIQKWSELPGETLVAKLYEAIKFTEGGLVVYGSFIGGFLGIATWAWLRNQRLLALADLIAPGLMLGVALGRIGCLLNGCCYGGVCEGPLPAITFPRGALPYLDQLSSGALLGLGFSPEADVHRPPKVIESVKPGSWAGRHSIQPQQTLNKMRVDVYPPPRDQDPAGPTSVTVEMSIDGDVKKIEQELPDRSLPTHPTQIYSSINAFLICGCLFTLWPNMTRDGLVLGTWLAMYGISRMFEEWIRIDEAGQFGTSLSISQWISLVGIAVGFVIIALRPILPLRSFRQDSP